MCLIQWHLESWSVKNSYGGMRSKMYWHLGYFMLSFPTISAVLLLVLLFSGAPEAISQTQKNNGCGHSTVEDASGPEFASRAKVFFAELQAAVEKNDTAKFASMVHYPVRVFSGKGGGKVSTAAQLIERYSQIMTPAVRKAILEQSPACPFGNGQGVMIGGGEIWFAEQSNGNFKVITINVDAPR